MRAFLDLELKRLSFCLDRKEVKRPQRIEPTIAPIEPAIEPKEVPQVDVCY